MADFDRKKFIEIGISKGANADQISERLAIAGDKPLSNLEKTLINEGKYGTNVFQRGMQDLNELSRGISTIPGAAISFFTDKDFRNQVLKPENLSNFTPVGIGKAITKTYVPNPGTIKVDPLEQVKDTFSGIATHPVTALLDFLPIIGPATKGVKTGTKGVIGAIGKVNSPNVPRTVQGFKGEANLLSDTVNDILNVSKDAPVKETTKLKDTLSELNKKYTVDDVAQVYKNLETGLKEGTPTQIKATEEIGDFAKEVDNLMKKVGVNPTKSEETAIFQKMVRDIKTDSGLDIPMEDIRRAANSDKGLEKLSKFGLDKETLATYFEDANKAFKQGDIVPLRHGSRDVINEGLVTPEDMLKGVMAERRYGTQSYSNLAKAFNEGAYLPLLDELGSARKATGAINEIIDTIGVPVSKTNLPTLGKGETLVSKNFINDVVGQAVETGKGVNKTLGKTIETLTNNPEALKSYDDLYIVRKKDLGAIKNSLAPDTFDTGVIGNLASIGKQTALSSLHYVIGNEYANITSNLANGIGLKSYNKAIKLHKELPDALIENSSYKGYLGKDLPKGSDLSNIYKQLFKDLKEGKDGEVFGRIRTLKTMGNTPIFRGASNLETIDRGAAYFKYVDDIAKELGKTAKQVHQDARVNGGNNPTFREIKRRIDNTLGDYVGRNYYINPNADSLARALVPFHRVYTQSARTLYNVAKNNPLGYQTQIHYPSILGNQFTSYGEANGVYPDEEYGGFPVQQAYGRYPSKVMYTPYHNATAIGEIAGAFKGGNPELLPTVNTFGIAPYLALMGLNRYGREAQLPNSITVQGKSYVLDNNGNITNYEPTIGDRIKLATAQLGQSYGPFVNELNSTILPMIAAATGQDYRAPSDYSILGQVGDLKIPLLSEGRRTTRDTTEEKLLPVIGITIKETYRKHPNNITLRNIKGVRRKQFIQEQKNRR